jgi:hypothetical protein
MINVLKHIVPCWRMCVLIAIATKPLVAAPLDQTANRSARVALYASVGEELIGYSVDVERVTLTRQSSVSHRRRSASAAMHRPHPGYCPRRARWRGWPPNLAEAHKRGRRDLVLSHVAYVE